MAAVDGSIVATKDQMSYSKSEREIAPGVYVLGTKKVNWYVVERGGKFTVVDTGLPKHWPQLGAFLSEAGADISDVEAVLITHVHGDHAGNAEPIRKEAGATVYAHESEWPEARREEKQRYASPVTRLKYVWRPSILSFLWEMMVRGGFFRFPAVVELSSLDDGQTVDAPGRPTVVHIPGHTPGACALHFAEDRMIFTGDALVTFNPAVPEPRRWGEPQIAADCFQHDADQALKSLDRLEGLEANVMLPGHGDPWPHGIASAVQRARELGRS